MISNCHVRFSGGACLADVQLWTWVCETVYVALSLYTFVELAYPYYGKRSPYSAFYVLFIYFYIFYASASHGR